MSVLPDWQISEYVKNQLIIIDPFEEKNVQAASYDFRLGNRFLFLHDDLLAQRGDVSQLLDNLTITELEQDRLFLPPGQAALGMTKEWFALSDTVGAKVYTKSGIGRLHIATTTDAGWFDPGFRGYGVLELRNNSSYPVTLLAGQRVGQLVFEQLAAPSRKAYEGNFQDQKDFNVERWKASLQKLVSEVRDGQGQTNPATSD